MVVQSKTYSSNTRTERLIKDHIVVKFVLIGYARR